MRALLRHLPLLLTLLIPLGLLAWFGSQELSRLEERTRSILQDEAHRFLKTEEGKVRTEIEDVSRRWLFDTTDEGLAKLLTESKLTLPQIVHRLTGSSPILDVFLLDDNFDLVAPRAPAASPPAAPLNEVPIGHDNAERDLVTADALFVMGDKQGAIDALKSYLPERIPADPSPGEIWASFRLAVLQDQTGKGEDALTMFLRAKIAAENIENSTEDSAFVQLFSTIFIAELNIFGSVVTQRSPTDLTEPLEILHGICARTEDFEYTDRLSDQILDIAVYRQLAAFFPPGSAMRNEYETAEELYRVRRLGRQFARNYARHGGWRLKRERRGKGRPDILYHVLSTDEGASLLALRPATDWIESRYRRQGATWVGIRLDLSALIGKSLSANPTSGPGNIALAIHDPGGVPILANETTPAENVELDFPPYESPVVRGLRFVAVPVTDPKFIQSAERNQLILALILVAVALGGAFMLIRSVRHQTQLAAMKVQLLSRVTHELKTPLAVIKMYGETLGLGRARNQEQVSKFAGIISAESDRLTHMVEQILDFSKMEAGTFSYEKQRIDLGELVESVKDEYQPHVESQGKTLEGTVTTGLWADVDPMAMSSAVVNLIENAVKYTPTEEARTDLEVELHRSNGHAVLEVRDRGLGIPREERNRVFDDFYRASNAGEIRGAGLGLSLVQHFARSHDGRIEVLERDGGGTTMRMTLPLAPEREPAPTNEPT